MCSMHAAHALMCAVRWWHANNQIVKYLFMLTADMDDLRHAGRTIKTGLIAVDVISHW